MDGSAMKKYEKIKTIINNKYGLLAKVQWQAECSRLWTD